MPEPLDYMRSWRPYGVSDLRAAMPKIVAGVMAIAVVLGWLGFFAFGGMIAVETHFTNRPQDHPEFYLTPWRPAATAGAGQPHARLTRDAIYPLTLRTLRYCQVSDDGGATTQSTGYYADVRWGPTTLALLATTLAPAISYVGLKRLLR